ncbi:hypothetical protein PVA45_04295 [Entomospira entomophila]|uniref:Lipoprotein n=1 Tax=Entomospira entomophila TaxID=2719988 RepID=A0A968GE19_9SPIO|nr:hypothetical protein [Entomospira entomophilus]NIZ40729.1 hypothetical protein [Entomospira entomophilus]WDI34942.1 hypothetical protein PVA45_04295 [Entomospira entomophilus]
MKKILNTYKYKRLIEQCGMILLICSMASCRPMLNNTVILVDERISEDFNRPSAKLDIELKNHMDPDAREYLLTYSLVPIEKTDRFLQIYPANAELPLAIATIETSLLSESIVLIETRHLSQSHQDFSLYYENSQVFLIYGSYREKITRFGDSLHDFERWMLFDEEIQRMGSSSMLITVGSQFHLVWSLISMYDTGVMKVKHLNLNRLTDFTYAIS